MPSDALTSTIFDLTELVEIDDTRPYAFGGFADIWLGTYAKSPGETHKVAIKRLRVRSPDEEPTRLAKYLSKELRVWKRIDHPNILPLYGLTYKMGATLPAMVCPWQENGNLSQFLAGIGMRISIQDRYNILLQTARGLQYLHGSSIIHGDLTGSNVLISRDNHVFVGDFGLSRIKRESPSSSYGSSSTLSIPGGAGAVRWAAPELFLPDDQGQLSPVSFAGDTYSFASVWLQVLSGHIPYHHLKNEVVIILQLSRGERPPRPAIEHLDDIVWVFIQRCWSTEPSLRPDVDQIVSEVEKQAAVSASPDKFIKSSVDDIPNNSADFHAGPALASSPLASTSGSIATTQSNLDQFKPVAKPSIRSRLHKLSKTVRFATRLSHSSGSRLYDRSTPVVDQIGVPDHQGYIQRKRHKSGNFGGPWQTCYLILKGKHLYRLGSGELKAKRLKGYNDLSGYQVLIESSADGLPTEFRLFKLGDPVQYFRSADAASIQDWIRVLRDAIALTSDSSVSTVSISSMGCAISASSSEEEYD
ncbi:hypothetical protein D9758_009634 [Tetrapyrgos nigripes]|uniref:Non-specific serine/threonine protein kinase n=1 Tax=Tetrapyrgos nigripes TaxID=182062 RepID=A0A8H5GD05_9AGAR|nr:hypothetical protein D9758_009634 [Tetrapyrgos nigripes]